MDGVFSRCNPHRTQQPSHPLDVQLRQARAPLREASAAPRGRPLIVCCDLVWTPNKQTLIFQRDGLEVLTPGKKKEKNIRSLLNAGVIWAPRLDAPQQLRSTVPEMRYFISDSQLQRRLHRVGGEGEMHKWGLDSFAEKKQHKKKISRATLPTCPNVHHHS